MQSIGADTKPSVDKKGQALIESYKNPNNGVELRRVLINGGKHEWPASNERYAATDEIWEFLKQHPKALNTSGDMLVA
ncbi:MAG TPA: hypothetical protein V6D17_08105 [Candidatus Obscuribacterales bacterium]